MEFTYSAGDIVQSTSQRWLLDYWRCLRGTSIIPTWQGVAPDQLGSVAYYLSYTDVVGSDGDARFRIRFHGEGLAIAYGQSCVGRYLDELLPDSFRDVTLRTYRQVLHERLPLYSVSDMRDANGRIVHYERLLLPFAHDGINVDRIMASLETSSPEGEYRHRHLMTTAQKAPAFALCTMIEV
jgi:hypothetical protein